MAGVNDKYGEGSNYLLEAGAVYADGVKAICKKAYGEDWELRDMKDLSSALALATKMPSKFARIASYAVYDAMGELEFGEQLRKEYWDAKPEMPEL
jgi:hypothetical protein